MNPFAKNACWIGDAPHDYGENDAGYYDDHRNAVLTKEFVLDEIRCAKLCIAALGYYVCKINDMPVSDSVLNGSWTNYTKVVYFEEYPVTNLLKKGVNTIEIELGNGFYNPSPLRFFGKYNLRERLTEVGTPQAIATLFVDENPCISTDASWSVKKGKLLFNNVYLGERCDFTLDQSSQESVCCNTTQRNFLKNPMPPIAKTQSVLPVEIQDNSGSLLVDFGEMITGFIHIEFNGNQNQKVRMRFCERKVNGDLEFLSNVNGSVGEVFPDGHRVDGGPGAPEIAYEQDIVIAKEGKNVYENTFTYHSFRYVLLENLTNKDIENLQAFYVHTDVKKTGSVKIDHPFLSDLQSAAIRTRLNNLHSSFEDCARERLGYGGDMISLADSGLYTFDLQGVYEKIIRDFRLDQTKNGGVPETAPYMGIQSQGTAQGEGPLLWQYAYPYLNAKLIQYYDDKSFVLNEYPYLQKQIDYLLSFDPQELSKHCLGDHGSVLIAGQFYKPTPDKPFVGWCTIVLFLQTFIQISHALNLPVHDYEERLVQLKEQVIKLFKNANGTFGDDTQTSLAFAAAANLGDPQKLAAMLAKKVEEEKIFNSGIFGMKYSYDLLHRFGYDQIVEDWLCAQGDISFAKMLSCGSKAMAELFMGEHYSDNHAMFTSFLQWYYEAYGGISIDETAQGFDKIRIAPFFSKRVNEASCKIKTKHGEICSNWKRDAHGKIHWDLQVPEGIEIITCDEKVLPGLQMLFNQNEMAAQF